MDLDFDRLDLHLPLAVSAGSLALALLVGCGNDDGRDASRSDAQTSVEPTAEQVAACERYGSAACDVVERCPGDSLPGGWGEHCGEIVAQRCLQLFALPGVDQAADGTLALARELESAQCLSAVTWDAYLGPFSRAPGMLQEGARCVEGLQCASGFCELDGACGHCTALASEDQALGEACGSSDDGLLKCGEGLSCVADAMSGVGACIEQPVPGGRCFMGSCLRNDLECVNGSCQPASFEDESCDPALDRCAARSGLRCDAERLVCAQSLKQVGLGESCGGMKFAGSCEQDARCALPESANPGIYDGPGRCQPIASLGDACTDSDQCALSLECRDEHCVVEPRDADEACE